MLCYGYICPYGQKKTAFQAEGKLSREIAHEPACTPAVGRLKSEATEAASPACETDGSAYVQLCNCCACHRPRGTHARSR